MPHKEDALMASLKLFNILDYYITKQYQFNN